MLNILLFAFLSVFRADGSQLPRGCGGEAAGRAGDRSVLWLGLGGPGRRSQDGAEPGLEPLLQEREEIYGK